jgi:hypothetical protein
MESQPDKIPNSAIPPSDLAIQGEVLRGSEPQKTSVVKKRGFHIPKFLILLIALFLLLGFMEGGYFYYKNSQTHSSSHPLITPTKYPINRDSSGKLIIQKDNPTPTLDPQDKNIRLYSGNPSDLYECSTIKNLEYGPIRTVNNNIWNVGFLTIEGKLVSKNQESWYMGEPEQPIIKGVFLEIPKQTGSYKEFYNLYVSEAMNNWAGAEVNNGNLLFRLGAFITIGNEKSLKFSSSAELPENVKNIINNNLDKDTTVRLRLFFSDGGSDGDASGDYTGACRIEVES